jgi:hypothetical protein
MDIDFKSTVSSFISVKDLCLFMQNNLLYCNEQQRQIAKINGYWWKTPEETFIDRYGFCYDLAAFALDGLIYSHLAQAKLLFVAWGRWGVESNSGHIVCFYHSDDLYWSIDNAILKGPFNYDELLLNTSRGHNIHTVMHFEAIHIPYHIRYEEMTSFINPAICD